MSPSELNAAVGEAAKSVVQTVFQAADTDRNNALSMEEYDKALTEPAHAVFRVIDANGDNMLSLAELQRAEQILRDQVLRLRVPDRQTRSRTRSRMGRPPAEPQTPASSRLPERPPRRATTTPAPR